MELGIVSVRKDGKWMHYAININGCDYAKTLLSQITKALEKHHLTTVNVKGKSYRIREKKKAGFYDVTKQETNTD